MQDRKGKCDFCLLSITNFDNKGFGYLMQKHSVLKVTSCNSHLLVLSEFKKSVLTTKENTKGICNHVKGGSKK